MKVSIASAPGKAIIFGEHAVVYKKPAISVAVDKRAQISISSSESQTLFTCNDLNIKSEINLEKKEFHMISGQEGIVYYILETLKLKHNNDPININLTLDMPIGSGLGSSAAITVALIAALTDYHNQKLDLDEIAKTAHKVELNVQGSASPLDTATSTYGGLIFLDENSKVSKLNANFDEAMVIGYTSQRGNTAKMVSFVKKLKENYPLLIDSIIDTMGNITLQAKELFEKETLNEKDFQIIADLLNINQGLLDAIGVNTLELSKMIYDSRKTGAMGSKLTGAGGGGSIIALCPGKTEEVLKTLKSTENAIKTNFSKNGVMIHNI